MGMIGGKALTLSHRSTDTPLSCGRVVCVYVHPDWHQTNKMTDRLETGW